MSNKYLIVLAIGVIMISLGIYLTINQSPENKTTGFSEPELQDVDSTIANAKRILKIIGIGTIATGIVEIAIAVGVKIKS